MGSKVIGDSSFQSPHSFPTCVRSGERAQRDAFCQVADSSGIKLTSQMKIDFFDLSVFSSEQFREIERFSLKRKVNLDCTLCFRIFCKAFYVVVNKVCVKKVFSKINAYDFCFWSEKLYRELFGDFKFCFLKHQEETSDRLCIKCEVKHIKEIELVINLIFNEQWSPPLDFGIAAAFLFEHSVSRWVDCRICLPPNIEPEYTGF